MDHRTEAPDETGCGHLPRQSSRRERQHSYPRSSASITIMSNTESPATEPYGPADPDSVSVPSGLTSDGTKLVYLYLQVSGESTLDELNQSLEMKTISLLPILDTLVGLDLVAREGNTYLPTAS